ncbi:ATP-binding protein [Corticimicrobacter populi]|uniref:histidine kinase n=1 Tax=Corticimicrobacter populi TaxID=2175229 RepID=A0A2V1JZS1_9BURK|nr:ATP-binding protein [Corticimicrobacter populi]PWF23266.1 two-component sensor histidine kinase [Corticimicrobacter populi]
MHSLRLRLTLSLFLTLFLFWIAGFAYQSVQLNRTQSSQWDAILQDIGLQMLATLSHDVLYTDDASAMPLVDPADLGALPAEQITFQVWEVGTGRLLLRSTTAPDTPLNANFHTGFSVHNLPDSGGWRVYSVSDKGHRFQVQVARSHDLLRKDYLHWVKGSLIFTLLIMLLQILIVWIVVRRSFKPVDSIRTTLQTRDPFDLTPLPPTRLPTELSPLIEAVNQLLRRLKTALDRERHFIADTAHELRTPLAALSTQAEIAARSRNPEDTEKALQKLLATAQTTSRLAEQFLAQARLDTIQSCEAPCQTDVPLHQIATVVARDLESSARRKQQRITLLLEPCQVNGHMDALGVLLRNLLENALRYTQEQGRIELICRTTQDQRVELSVADNGPGIPESEYERIFERFYRLANTPVAGSGIGLSLVQRIAHWHQAEIQCSTGLEGKGFRICILFGIVQQDTSR